MKKNLGSADRLVRVAIAALIAVLYFTNMISGTIAVVLLVAAGILAATSLVSFCPLYAMLGINSCPVNKARP